MAEALRSGKDGVTAFGYVMHCMRETLLDFEDVSNEQGEDVDTDEVEETMSLGPYRARGQMRHRATERSPYVTGSHRDRESH